MAKYGTGVKYGTNHRYGETAEIFTAESALSVSYGIEGGFGYGGFGEEFFGSGLDGAVTVTFTQEAAATPVYTEE